MTPYEIALRCTRPLTPEEAELQQDEYAGKELPDPCPQDLQEMMAMAERIEAHEARGRA